MLEYRGRVERVIFENEGFYIFSFNTSDKLNIKAKGIFMGTAIRPHQDLILRGEWKRSKYGRDFAVSSFEEVEPSDVEGITRYLQANVKGVGWVTAKKVADHFGENTVDILTKDPRRIYECGFLNDSQKHLIHETLTRNQEYRDISVFLMSFEVSANMVQRIYQTFGTETVETLTEDPYRLTRVRGIGFQKADAIAMKMGIDPKAPIRVRAVIHYILDDIIRGEGHLYQTAPKLKKKAKEMLDGVKDKIYNDALESLQYDGRIQIEGNRIYSYQSYYVEQQGAFLLHDMISPVDLDFDLEAYVERYERIHSSTDKPFRLSDEQLQALELTLVSKVLVITGLPGTGKTTVLRAIVGMFEEFNKKVALMTPTGISAKRLKQVAGRPAGTIHRTLGCKGDGEWAHNPDNPLPVDVVIVDEASMIDQALFYRLLRGIRPDSTLILVGDSAQLPSVGPGNVLREIINSEVISTVELTTIHRQEEASDIIINAHRINAGESLLLKPPKEADFKFFKLQEESVILERIVYVAKRLHDKGIEFQMLSPRHAGTLGVSSLNEQLRETLNPDVGQDKAEFGKAKSFRVGDRVMVTRNRYDHGVFNGDIGTVLVINRKDRTIQFRVDGNTVPTVFTYSDALEDMVLAYCVTIHKSQGSEWEFVLMPMVTGFSIQLVRNLFYTGVTRARRTVMVFGHMRAMNKAIANDRVQHRNTAFAERLQDLVEANG